MANHKNPAARAHLWERPARPDEVPASPVVQDYKHALPRYLHDDELATLLVSTPEACEAALKDGWTIEPQPQTVYHSKSGEEHQVGTVDERTHALAQGWSLTAPSGDTLKDHDDRIAALAAEIERLKAASASAKSAKA